MFGDGCRTGRRHGHSATGMIEGLEARTFLAATPADAELGNLRGIGDDPLQFSGSVNTGPTAAERTRQIVAFSVARAFSNVKLSVPGLTGNDALIVKLLEDRNGNRALDEDELEAEVTDYVARPGEPDHETANVPRGDYLARTEGLNADFTAAGVRAIPYQLTIADGGTPQIRVEYNGVRIANGDTTPSLQDGTDFGGVRQNPTSTGPTHEFIVRNTGTGTAALNIERIGFSFDAFTVTDNFADTRSLAPGETAKVVVTLLSAEPGLKEDRITLSTNDTTLAGAFDEREFEFRIRGFVSARGEDLGSVGPAPVQRTGSVSIRSQTDFAGGHPQDHKTETYRFAIDRLSDVRLEVAVTGGNDDVVVVLTRDRDGDGFLDPGEYDDGNRFARTVAKGQGARAFNVEDLAAGAYFVDFSPKDDGMSGDSLFSADFSMKLSAAALAAPDLRVTGAAEVEAGDDSPSAGEGTGFGSVVKDAPAPQRTFTVKNTGGTTLQLGGLDVGGGFDITSQGLPPMLAPNATATFTLAMLTGGVGDQRAVVSFETGVPGKDPFRFTVAGTVVPPGTDPGPDPDPDPDPDPGPQPGGAGEVTVLLAGVPLAAGQAIDFGSTARGQVPPTRTITVRNDGDATLALGTPALPAGFVLAEPLAASLAPGASDTFQVSVDTSQAATLGGALAVPSDDADEGAFTLQLAAVVTPPPPVGVADVVAKVPASVVQGAAKGKATLSVLVRNDTDADVAEPVTVAVHASADAALDGGDTRLAESAKPLKLKPGQTKAVKLSVPLASIPAGQQTLLASATAGGLTAVRAGPGVSVEPAVVRLRGLAGGAAPAGKPFASGKKATLSVPLRNDGNVVTAKSPVTYTLVVSTDGTEAGRVGEVTASGKVSLKPGAAKPQKLSVTFPVGAFAPGSYTIIVMLSAELNEGNGQVVALLPATFV